MSEKLKKYEARVNAVRRELRQRQPELMQELELNEQLAALHRNTDPNDLSFLAGVPRKAIPLALEDIGRPATVEELFAVLTQRKFYIGEPSEKVRCNSSINALIANGTLKVVSGEGYARLVTLKTSDSQ